MATIWRSRHSRKFLHYSPRLSSSLSLSSTFSNSNPLRKPNPTRWPVEYFKHTYFGNQFSRKNASCLDSEDLKFNRHGPISRFSAGISTSSSGVAEKHDEDPRRDKDDDSGPKVRDLSWIDLYLPKSARPYAHLARLDRPIGTWLLAWPCMW